MREGGEISSKLLLPGIEVARKGKEGASRPGARAHAGKWQPASQKRENASLGEAAFTRNGRNSRPACEKERQAAGPRDNRLEPGLGQVVVGPCCGSLSGLIWLCTVLQKESGLGLNFKTQQKVLSIIKVAKKINKIQNKI